MKTLNVILTIVGVVLMALSGALNDTTMSCNNLFLILGVLSLCLGIRTYIIREIKDMIGGE